MHPFSPAPLLLLSLNVAVFFAVLFNYLLVSPAGPMGRFFFPALSSLAILMFYGLTLLVNGKGSATHDELPTTNPPPSSRVTGYWSLLTAPWSLAVAANLLMLALSLVALFGYLRPAYARPPSFPADAALPNPIDVRFDTFVALRGYAVDTERVRPGQPVGIELYWEVLGAPPGDYLLFVHLTDDETGALVAQRDTHPGLGNFPSSHWRPGDRFVERLNVYLPETAYTPSAAGLTIGLYAPEGYRLGITDGATGAGLGDAFPIGRVAIDPHAPDDEAAVPNPGRYNFENRLRLLGYDYGARVLAPGEPVGLTLYWEALRPSPGDYEVQIRLLDAGGNVLATQQTRPGNGARPTTAWSPGEVVVETYQIPLDAAAGTSITPEIILVDAATGTRLNLIGEDGRWLFDYLRLSPIMISD